MKLSTAIQVILTFAFAQSVHAQAEEWVSTSSASSSSVSAPSSTPSSPASACSTPSTVSGFNNAALPNPFTFNDGTPVLTASDWTCRRAQIAALIQGYEAGTLPGPPETLTSTFTQSGTTGTLAITAANGGPSFTFSQTITFPSGTAPAGGWPLLIAFEGGSIPVPSGVSSTPF
ncbi:hypothetical protein PHLCEN_2v10419 [Hermanssonia centrifuga]|uniref:Uncharacterized protein n=1 Tax=Hermanssonia centrifuga TaxID=98765 RepID=A0A2R6NMW9_9APHY|nr:hypothetical protein PHLCEN_2v10419 [Hermanssonia centrifuga]